LQFTFNNQTFNIKFWTPEIGKLGRFVSVDTETTMAPFFTTPDLVTCQAYSGGSDVYYIPKVHIKQFLFTHSESFFIGQNFVFDNDVLQKFTNERSYFYGRYDRNLNRDVGILWRLYHLAEYGFVPFKRNLGFLSEKMLGIPLVKDETRENFGQFLNVPEEEIPENYLEYGAIDAVATYQIYFRLVALIKPHDKFDNLLSHDIQAKGDLALLHIHKNGIGFDLEARDEWLKDIDTKMENHSNILASWGWVRGKKGIKDVYSNIMDRLGISSNLPRSEKSGELSSKAEDLAPYRSYQFVDSYLEYQYLEKASSFVREISSSTIHPRYNLLVNTGRTSCSSPNFQQLPKLGGIREMFKAKPGNTLLITDYSAIELATLAQVCYSQYGYSEMRNRINAGEDLHRYYASIMNNCAIEDVTKQQRQEAKAANFGFPGGLGIETFIEFSRGYGLELTNDVAQEMKDVWFTAFPEMDSYMNGEKGFVYTLTGRKRGDTSYCAEKNTPFQGLAADGAKLALYNMDKAGLKIVGFVHDEIITEVSKEKVEELTKLQEKIMIEYMNTVAPDVKIGVETTVSDFYTK